MKKLLIILFVLFLAGCNSNEVEDLENEILLIEQENYSLTVVNNELTQNVQDLEDEILSIETQNEELMILVDEKSEEIDGLTLKINQFINETEIMEFINDTKVSDSNITSEYLIGTWHSGDCIGSAYGTMYHFFADGKYVLCESGYDSEGRLVCSLGSWKVMDNLLYLTVDTEYWREGGYFEEDGISLTGYYLADSEIVRKELEEPKTIIYPISNNDDYPDADIITTNKFGGVAYWRLQKDPMVYFSSYIRRNIIEYD